MVDGVGTTAYAFTSGGLLQSEDGPWDRDTVIYVYNNWLNQITNCFVSDGSITVSGTTTSPATNVTVNGSNALLYADNTFARTNYEYSFGTNTFTAIARDASGRIDTNTISYNLRYPTYLVYDLNGNLLSDGLRAFDYDDENQLTRVTVTNVFKSEFTYDGKMRRRIRKEYLWQSGAWHFQSETRYIYDGNLVIQERDALNLPTVAYTRGKDLSGGLEGAGGIGGLVAFSDLKSSISNPSQYFYHSDANGNVTMLINSNQLAVAKYLYDPFGNLLSASGPVAEANLYRFSSKEAHPASGLVYYLYRHYEPNLQRWINKDQVGELGFRITLRRNGNSETERPYVFVANHPTGLIDPYGLKLWVCTVTTSGFPLYGLGRHAYFWDDSPGTPKDKRECGQEGSSGSDGNTSGNIGPNSGDSGNPWVRTGDSGYRVRGCRPRKLSRNEQEWNRHQFFTHD